jgi:DNA mismatch repair protein MutS
MTEMIEVANILHNATNKSFIIFDELGRWTSTYDWLALTKAILEYIATQVGAKTLIATHYHELIALEWQLPGVQNHSVSVYETDKEVVFMKKIVKWWASKSYGLDVAKIAGIPSAIIERAKENLDALQMKHGTWSNLPAGRHGMHDTWWNVSTSQLFNVSTSERDPRYEKIKSFLEGYDLNTVTPLQALQLLAKIKDDTD